MGIIGDGSGAALGDTQRLLAEVMNTTDILAYAKDLLAPARSATPCGSLGRSCPPASLAPMPLSTTPNERAETASPSADGAREVTDTHCYNLLGRRC